MKLEKKTANESTVANLQPSGLWQEFALISNIPRASRKEAAIIRYIEQKAKALKLAHKTDKAGNLLVHLPAILGFEDKPGLILQGHVDMVCEKDQDTEHDFDHDPIQLVIDGELLRANKTTLGADNGVAVAMMLHLMDGNAPHGKVDLLFTIDEETGLTGALNLSPDMLQFQRLINLDGEEEGIFYIGCAGGKETVGELAVQYQGVPKDYAIIRINLTGLGGGHSGADIHLQPGNALKLLSRILWQEHSTATFSLIDFHGGDKHNAICREAFAAIAIPNQQLDTWPKKISDWHKIIRMELGTDEPGLSINLQQIKESERKTFTQAINLESQEKFLRIAMALPHGVLGMSRNMPGLVSTSTNLAAIKMETAKFIFVTSQRSDRMSSLLEAAHTIRAVLESNGARCNFMREYPAWPPQPQSPLLNSILESYYTFNPGNKPTVTAIHAGLECGVIGDRQPGMDMISFGPNIRGAHTPTERLEINSMVRVWNFLVYYLGRNS